MALAQGNAVNWLVVRNPISQIVDSDYRVVDTAAFALSGKRLMETTMP